MRSKSEIYEFGKMYCEPATVVMQIDAVDSNIENPEIKAFLGFTADYGRPQKINRREDRHIIRHALVEPPSDAVQTQAAVAEWYRHRIVAGFVTSSSPVPLKTRRVGQRCTLNLSRAEMSSRWCGVVVRRGGASSGVVHVT
ncbi:uncharacterized protein TNCV_57471 [Trichonephila clavipes]|nr:uncharacterized protein TNCV_57471 [Trichonephila clavipes]